MVDGGLRLEGHGRVVPLPSLCTLAPLSIITVTWRTGKPCPAHAAAHAAGEKRETALNAALEAAGRHAAFMPWATVTPPQPSKRSLLFSRSLPVFRGKQTRRSSSPAHLAALRPTGCRTPRSLPMTCLRPAYDPPTTRLRPAHSPSLPSRRGSALGPRQHVLLLWSLPAPSPATRKQSPPCP